MPHDRPAGPARLALRRSPVDRFAGDDERFARLVHRWLKDVRERARRLAADAFPDGGRG